MESTLISEIFSLCLKLQKLGDWSQGEKLSEIKPPLKERKNCKFTPVKNSQNF